MPRKRFRTKEELPGHWSECKDEAEEAEWWYAHRDETEAQLIKAIRSGRAKRLTGQELAKIEKRAERAKEDYKAEMASTKPISIRLPKNDLEMAKAIARTKRIPYQTLIKSVVHRALMAEFRQMEKAK